MHLYVSSSYPKRKIPWNWYLKIRTFPPDDLGIKFYAVFYFVIWKMFYILCDTEASHESRIVEQNFTNYSLFFNLKKLLKLIHRQVYISCIYSSMYFLQTVHTYIVNIQIKEKHSVSSLEAPLQSPLICHPLQGDHLANFWLQSLVFKAYNIFIS